METERQPVRSWITEGIFIALITASAYFWAFRYEVGWCEHFQMPFYLISLNMTSILAISGPLIYFFAVPLLVIVLIAQIMALIRTPFNRFSYEYPALSYVLMTIIWLIVASSILISGREQLHRWFWVGMVVVVLFPIAVFVRPLITHRGEGRYWDKFRADINPPRQFEPSNFQFPPRFINFVVLFVFFICVVLGNYLSYWGGKKDAQSQEVFPIITHYPEVPEVVVLRTFGDYFLTAPLDRSSKEVEKKLYMLKISDMAKIPLTREKVGPLRVKP
jgi:hypothetical protein